MRRFRQLVAVAIVCALAVPAFADIQYTLTDLGSFGGFETNAFALNNSGVVVGDSYNVSNSYRRPYVYSGGVMTDTGTFGGPAGSNRGINAAGDVVGLANVSQFVYHASLYSGGVLTDLGTLGGDVSIANDINNVGPIAGFSLDSTNSLFHAFIYSGGVMTDIGTLGGYESQANAINDGGTAVGYSYLADDATIHAFKYSSGVMTDLGTFGGDYAIASDISPSGMIVGIASTAGNAEFRAFTYSNGTMTALPALAYYSDALGINSSHEIVGYYLPEDGYHAFIYKNGVTTDLNTLIDSGLGWQLLQAYDINDSGQIVGWGYDSNFEHRAFLLTPIAAPEPASLSVLALGGFFLLARRRK